MSIYFITRGNGLICEDKHEIPGRQLEYHCCGRFKSRTPQVLTWTACNIRCRFMSSLVIQSFTWEL